MSDISPKKDYWHDLLSGVASDLDQMLDDLCLEETPQPHQPISRVPSLLEQHVQGLGSLAPGQNSSSKKEDWESDASSEYKRSPHLTSSPGRRQQSISSDLSSYEPTSDQKSSCASPSNESSTLSTESIYVAEISLLERLICTHPIWFLPDIQRTGTVHLLQGKEPGNYIIRKSSQPNTMALSVRLPEVTGPYIEHYLIEKTEAGNLRLEGSDLHFPSVPLLVAHYCQCCDELPVQLCLPRTLALANSRQELLSLALLGQDFWVSSWFSSVQGDRNSADRPKTIVDGSCSGKPKLPTPDSPPVSSFGSHVTPSLRSSPPPLPTAPKPYLLQLSSDVSECADNETNGSSPSSQSSLLAEESSQNLVNGCDGAVLPSPKVKLADPYHLSGIVDSPGLYYHSSLADKISDYEDIWGTPQTVTEKKRFVTFKPHSQLASVQECRSPDGKDPEKTSPQRNSPKRENVYIQAQVEQREMVSHYTQTDDSNRNSVRRSLELSRQCSRSVQDMRCQDTSKIRFSSPFYSEPIDAISSTAFPFDNNSKEVLSCRLVNHRHSDPNIPWISQRFLKKNSMKLKQSKDSSDSSQNSSKAVCAAKPPLPHDSAKCRITSESPWHVDSSWEWMSKEKGGTSQGHPQFSLDLKFPMDRHRTDPDDTVLSDTTTVEDLIVLQSPDLKLYDSSSSSSVAGASEYDNLDGKDLQPWGHSDASDVVDDTATEFSEPWDSLRWERLLHVAARNAQGLQQVQAKSNSSQSKTLRSPTRRRARTHQESESEPLIVLDGGDSSAVSSSETSAAEEEGEDGGEADDENEKPDKSPDRTSQGRTGNFQRKLDSFVGVSRVLALKNQDSGVGEAIRQYIYRLNDEKNNTFAMAIENFIQCTKESTETSPHVIMRNIRQFMTGMKNYLLKHGEGQFDQLVQQERSKLRSTEFLNIDAIIEGTLHKLVIKPLKNDIYQLFVNEYTKNDSLKSMCDNIKYAQNKTTVEMGIRPEFQPPEGPALQIVKHFLLKLQQEYSPLKKLENLLAAISTIYNCVQHKEMSEEHYPSSLGADDFLPIFIYVLVRCGMISAEIEADFMWGLLHPSLLSGEGGYYLTTLSSAVHVLKNFQASSSSPGACNTAGPVSLSNQQGEEDNIQNMQRHESPINAPATDNSSGYDTRLPSIADLQGFMKIMIPDEMSSSIISKTLPVRPNMTTKDVCKMIAHKFKITNPQDFGLFKLEKGEETQLADSECPQSLKAELLACGSELLFAYKRCDAKFIWPVMGV